MVKAIQAVEVQLKLDFDQANEQKNQALKKELDAEQDPEKKKTL